MEEKATETRALGVDVGTSKIVMAHKTNGAIGFSSQLNAFLTVEYSKLTEGLLRRQKIHRYRDNGSLVIFGDGAETFANMLNTATRRPMRDGLLNPAEGSAIEVIKGILDNLIPEPDVPGAQLCFSVPGMPFKEAESSLLYHESILKRCLAEKGYKVKSINEGLAVVFSELEQENFTGLGISAGGGMCNVCLAFLSVPVMTFSVKKAGDYIDEAVASATGEVTTRVRKIKEQEFRLTRKPENDLEGALSIFYDDVILTLVETILESMSSRSSKLPKFDQPVPIVLSGGSAMPEGFRERFQTCLEDRPLPFEVRDVRLASDPLNATAKGALIASMHED
ncbi:MAG: hypothetical protein AB1640_05120 [bacterium]